MSKMQEACIKEFSATVADDNYTAAKVAGFRLGWQAAIADSSPVIPAEPAAPDKPTIQGSLTDSTDAEVTAASSTQVAAGHERKTKP